MKKIMLLLVVAVTLSVAATAQEKSDKGKMEGKKMEHHDGARHQDAATHKARHHGKHHRMNNKMHDHTNQREMK